VAEEDPILDTLRAAFTSLGTRTPETTPSVLLPSSAQRFLETHLLWGLMENREWIAKASNAKLKYVVASNDVFGMAANGRSSAHTSG
jgi:hypothetical protein